MAEIQQTSKMEANSLTQGSILKNMLYFAFPVILGNLFTQFYNMADSIVVGQFVSSDALAAVGSSFALQMIVNSIFAGLGIGSSVLAAQYYGSQNAQAVQKTVTTTFTLAIIIGAVLTVVGVVGSRFMLELINTPANILEDATTYLVIVFIGSIGHLFYNMGGALLRGMGDSKGPLKILIFCTVTNVALDLLFVIVFGWGVAGVAWATIIAQCASAGLVVRLVLRGGYGVQLNRHMLQVDLPLAKKIAVVGVPTAMQMMLMSSGMVVIQSFVNSFGSDVVAASTAIMKVDGFLMQPVMGFGSALTTFVGQNLGAGKPERVKEGTTRAAQLTVIFCVLMAVPLYFWGGHAIRLFTPNEEVIRIAALSLQTLACFYVFMGINQCYTGAVRGAGAMTVPMLITLVTIVARIPLAWWLAVRANDFLGLYYSMNIANLLGAVLIVLYYYSGHWKKGLVQNPLQ